MLSKVQQIFSNREIASILWILTIMIVLSLNKIGRKFYKSVLPIIFCRKFILFYIVFICFLVGIINILQYIGFWNIYLLKDTIFWVIFVEIPIFIRALEKAKDQYFFRKLIRENIKWVILISFIVGFWSFSLWIEILIIPIVTIGTYLYYVADSDKKYIKVKKLLDNFRGLIGCYLIYFIISNLVMEWRQLYDFQTIKVFILPIILIILNMPVVYGLAVYNQYEQIFIRLKGRDEDKKRMKIEIVKFGRISLYRLSMLLDKGAYVWIESLNSKELEKNLFKFKKYLEGRIGDNYMKRAKLYYMSSIVLIVVSLLALIYCNSEVDIKDIIRLNFVLDIVRVKEIITQICCVGLVVGIVMFIFSKGLNQQKYEDLSKVKKIALSKFLLLLSYQNGILKDKDVKENDSDIIFNIIIRNAYLLTKESEVIKASYDNLLSRWELQSIDELYNASSSLLLTISNNREDFNDITKEEFKIIYKEKIRTSPQNEKINVFLYNTKKNIEKYISCVKGCSEELKKLLE
ncbi:hypothetical protein [Clostridium senegalense]|uniref:hypothetical protein n=1 Tax=Clostridium senegalense TaxID=1465809 RepID=UPI0002886029|nr:hypothetical protein [Clostridium senegalense]